MPVDFEALDRARLRYADTQNEAGVVGLPNGFLQGFKVTWDDFKVSVGPGIANVNGTQVAKDESTLIVERMWLVTRNQSTHYYIYLNREGNFEVDPTGPSQSTDNDFYSFHPITNARFIGRLYVDSDGDVVFGTSATKAVPEVVVGASTWLDDADYTCDGTADEVEINAAIAYLSDAFEGGGLSLSPGAFFTRQRVVIPTGMQVAGSGESATTINRSTDTGNRPWSHFEIGSSTATASNVGLRDMTLTFSTVSPGLEGAEEAVDAQYATDCLIERLTISCDGGEYVGVGALASTAARITVRDCTITDFSIGVSIANAAAIIVERNRLYYTGTAAPTNNGMTVRGINVASGGRMRVINNEIVDVTITEEWNGGLRGIFLSGTSEEAFCMGNRVANLSVLSTTIPTGIRVALNHVVVANNMVLGGRGWLGTASFVALQMNNGADDCIVHGNSLRDVDQGIEVASGVNRVLVLDNKVTDCGQLIDRGGCESTTVPVLTGSTTDAVTTSNASFARSSDQAYEGTYSYKLTITTGGTEGYVALADSESTTDLQGLLAGVEYTFEAWVMVATADGPAVGEVRLELRDYNGSWNQTNSSGTPTIDTWTKLTVTRAWSADAAASAVRIRIADTASSGEDIYVDNLRVYPTNSQNEHDNAIDDDGSQTRVS